MNYMLEHQKLTVNWRSSGDLYKFLRLLTVDKIAIFQEHEGPCHRRLTMNTPSKKTLTLVLSDVEMDVLDSLSSEKSLSKTAVLRQALRLYQTVDIRQQRGEKLFFESENKEKAELMLL